MKYEINIQTNDFFNSVWKINKILIQQVIKILKTDWFGKICIFIIIFFFTYTEFVSFRNAENVL